MFEVQLTDGTILWLNALAVRGARETSTSGISEIIIDSETSYFVESDIEKLTTRIHKSLRAISVPSR